MWYYSDWKAHITEISSVSSVAGIIKSCLILLFVIHSFMLHCTVLDCTELHLRDNKKEKEEGGRRGYNQKWCRRYNQKLFNIINRPGVAGAVL